MRVSITGEKDFVDSLRPTFELIDRQGPEPDVTELHFGLVEVSVIVGILSGISKLLEFIQAQRSKSNSEIQRLQVTTALGTMLLELKKDVSAEELQEQLSKIIVT